MPDAVAFRTDCRSKAEEKPIRAAKCCFEPRGTRLPDARISKPHPRKGTETMCRPLSHIRLINFKTTSPQGDGNATFVTLQCVVEMISKPYPRKGTETRYPSHATPCPRYFKTTSPQGDGNNLALSPNFSEAEISKPHPRKGTETSSSQNSKMVFTSDFKTTSPQGDGNETISSVSSIST